MQYETVVTMSELNHTLTSQLFAFSGEEESLLTRVCRQAEACAELDSSIVVVSDFRNGHCYIYTGTFGRQFGLRPTVDTGSAFEDCLFSHFHPDDEQERQRLELRYFRFLQQLPVAERTHYNTSCIIRIRNTEGVWRQVHYRVHYRGLDALGNMWLAVCFYAPAPVAAGQDIQGRIIHQPTGTIVTPDGSKLSLTRREKEILRLVGEGLASKQIADLLCVSEHTVNRHRQNIIAKLGVSNTAQALHAAHLVGVL
ncbi:MAG: helix-turn-helix transcriptional regulator [Paludibacteraceae bacterium]|nr:helix-turn-helix transcriptional regulator [Paludibacteraceae bacterium]